MQYKNLSDYIWQRCRVHDLALTDAAQRMGFSRGYLSSVAKDTFVPSRKRCIQIAEFFGDPPNLVLELAGYYVPEQDIQQHEEIARVAAALPASDRQLLLEIAYILKERTDRKMHAAR